jgi:hypothetical protein
MEIIRSNLENVARIAAFADRDRKVRMDGRKRALDEGQVFRQASFDQFAMERQGEGMRPTDRWSRRRRKTDLPFKRGHGARGEGI